MLKKSQKKNRPAVALIHYSGPPVISGVELIMRDHARFLNMYGYSVYILVGHGKRFRSDIPIHRIPRMDTQHELVQRITLELEKGIVSPMFRVVSNSLYRTISQYLIKNNIRMCIVHNVLTRHYNLALSDALLRIAQDFPNIRFIHWTHDATFCDQSYAHIRNDLITQYPWNILTTQALGWEYIAISEFRRKQLLELFGNEHAFIKVIPNGIDMMKFFNIAPMVRAFFHEAHLWDADLIACLPVRVVRRKNLEFAIHIIHALVQKGVDARLILTAVLDHHQKDNLKYFEELKYMVRKLHLGKNVFFLSEFVNAKTHNNLMRQVPVHDIFAISDFLLMTSTIEGFGLPVIEAGITRVPIFASDITPFREIGTTNIHYFSLHAKPEDVASFILLTLRELPHAYFYRKIIRKYSLRRIFEQQIIPLLENKF